MADAAQIAVEQEYFDHAAECRERSRATLIAAPASAAGPIASGSAVKRMTDGYLARMAGPDEAVAIGRFETEDETLYVGKRRISDDDGKPWSSTGRPRQLHRSTERRSTSRSAC